MAITSERRETCLNYLAETDIEYAKAKALMIGLEHQKYTVLSTQQLDSDYSSIGESKADAYTTKAYRLWRADYRDAVYDFELLKNKRSTATLIVELWRSELSARKAGMIV